MVGPVHPATGLRFASRRERRLWAWTAVVVVAIYSTLGLARVLADELRRRELADAAFAVAFVLILAAIVAIGVRARPGGLEVGVVIGVVAVYTLVLVRMSIPEERTHVVEYGVVAVLVHEALVERRRGGLPVRWPAPTALGLAIAAGTIDEVLQLAIPSRVFDPRDIVTNSLSAGLALGAKLVLGLVADRTRRRGGRPMGAGPP